MSTEVHRVSFSPEASTEFSPKPENEQKLTMAPGGYAEKKNKGVRAAVHWGT